MFLNNLKMLNLSCIIFNIDNRIGKKGIYSLSNNFKNIPNIESLYLNGIIIVILYCNIGFDEMKYICNNLLYITKIKVLSFYSI